MDCGCGKDGEEQPEEGACSCGGDADTEEKAQAGGCCGGESAPEDNPQGGGCCGGNPDIEPADDADRAQTAAPGIRKATWEYTLRDRWDHILARWGFDREGHRVEPGLYALGRPGPESPVFVTANYTLSFDALRTALRGIDGYILVLNTRGINVWCAAGKGTFGTNELIRRIQAVPLAETVTHRRIILPQLGAPGVDATAVAKATGFRPKFGPVRAADLPAFLRSNEATPEMRRVRFPLWDRMVLIPVELVALIVPILVLMLLRLPDFLTATLAGIVLFPILLPWLPTANYSTKGFILGALAAAPFAALSIASFPAGVGLQTAGMAFARLLALPPITAFIALNFTGSTPFPSRTGVRREIGRYIRPMAVCFGLGIALYLALTVLRLAGVAA